MSTIKAYIIISEPDLESLAHAVNSKIGEAWEPIGGITVIPNCPYPVIAQAMIFRAETVMYSLET